MNEKEFCTQLAPVLDKLLILRASNCEALTRKQVKQLSQAIDLLIAINDELYERAAG
jgi:hypothetical protein